jgi:hypothetical protein
MAFLIFFWYDTYEFHRIIRFDECHLGYINKSREGNPFKG